MKFFGPLVIDEGLQIVCVEVLWPSQPNGIMSNVVSLPNPTRLLGRLSPLSG